MAVADGNAGAEDALKRQQIEYRRAATPRTMETRTEYGMWSRCVGLADVLLVVGFAVAAALRGGEAIFIPLGIFAFFPAPLLALVGIALGVAALREERHMRRMGIAGLCASSLVLGGGILFWLGIGF